MLQVRISATQGSGRGDRRGQASTEGFICVFFCGWGFSVPTYNPHYMERMWAQGYSKGTKTSHPYWSNKLPSSGWEETVTILHAAGAKFWDLKSRSY